ncbi:DNA ligase N terminus-domain-containing protein [Mycena leptocephala]|nr:DNA ligase N terminus-domain-containing protein [Mycena leptocephala]
MSTTSQAVPQGVPFSFFVSLLREISRHSRSRKTGIRRDTHNASYPALRVCPLPANTTAIVFRLIFPEEDTRRKYDMQETRLASALSDCFGISATPLRQWSADGSSGCLGQEVLKVLNKSSSCAEDYISPLSIAEVDNLLEELASHSGYSDISVRANARATRRPKSTIIRALYRSLSPLDASFLTQIILKDLRPLLYPLADTHYTVALKSFNSVAVTHLSKEDAMKAWDPSRQMLNIYRVRSGLDDAAAAFDAGINGAVMPQIGTPIEIPKSTKGRGLIFSKSKRDSTLDRYGVHSVIREALGLSNIIVDAEMVAWHGEKIDEFWRIRSLVEHTAHGVRRQAHDDIPLVNYSQASLMTDVSDDRHLGLVFFDILMLNSTSLLSVPYSSRRAILESVIKPIPSRAILGDRTSVALNLTPNDTNPPLHRVFAQCLALPEEGLVLKAGEAGYNDMRFPWVKLKRDYIPGYGDCVDLVVLGGSWDKSRARELRVGPSAYTTFYIGGLHNAEQMQKDPSARPHFHIYFTASYGLSRDGLEETNFLIKSSDAIPYDPTLPSSDLPFTYSILPGLVPPTVILREPLLAELFGAGFTKSPRSRHYELRFPRITKIFRTSERGWRDGMTLQDLHKVARDIIGRDRSNKDLDDWGNSLWGKPVSPGVSLKRKSMTDKWEEKLIASDRKLARKRGWPAFGSCILTSDEVYPGPGALATRTNLEESRAPKSPPARTPRTPNPFTSSQSRKSRLPSVYPSPTSSPLAVQPPKDLQSPGTIAESISDVLSNSLVFVAAKNPRTIHSLESLFINCGWESAEPPSLTWVQRGVIVFDVDESAARKTRILNALTERKALCTDQSNRKAIWVLERNIKAMKAD